MKILTKNVEVVNNSRGWLRKAIYDKCVLVAKVRPDKRVCYRIFVIMIYEYNNHIFLSRWDSTSNVYTVIGIFNICFVYILYESEKICI